MSVHGPLVHCVFWTPVFVRTRFRCRPRGWKVKTRLSFIISLPFFLSSPSLSLPRLPPSLSLVSVCLSWLLTQRASEMILSLNTVRPLSSGELQVDRSLSLYWLVLIVINDIVFCFFGEEVLFFWAGGADLRWKGQVHAGVVTTS